MAIEKIREGLCTGCGICVSSCAVDVIRMDKTTRKATICYPQDCMLCEMCVMECPEGAIEFSPEKKTPFTLSWG